MKKLILFFLLGMVSLCGLKAEKVTKVACVGNSITWGDWLYHRDRDCYPAALARMMGKGYDVENFGRSGRCAGMKTDNPYRKDPRYGELKQFAPDIVVLMLGANDSREPNLAVKADYKKDLGDMVREIQALASRPRVFLCLPCTATTPAFTIHGDVIDREFVPAVRELSQELHTGLIDINALSKADQTHYPDGVHPDAVGAGHIAEAVYQALTGKKRQYDRPLSMPAIFTDHMVLQQNASVRLWGYAGAGRKVTVRPSWGNAVSVTADRDGRWQAEVRTPVASLTPREVTVMSGKEKIAIRDILMGEVWIASGQSNMEMQMGGYYNSPVIGGPEAIANSANDALRLFKVPVTAANRPEDDTEAAWAVASPACVRTFSATAYFFARQLQRSLGVPVGIIEAAYGGASIRSLMSRDALKAFPDIPVIHYWDGFRSATQTATVIYNAMIHPIAGYTLKGCIWYQGEADRGTPEQYKALYKAFMDSWRSEWQCGKFPFYYAQIAPYAYGNGNSAFIREAQEQIESDADNTAMICLMDGGMEHNIHPSGKETVGFRFAQRVLDKTYHVAGILSAYPHYKGMETKDGKIYLSFSGADDGLTTFGKPVTGVTVAGEDRAFQPASAYVSGNKLVVEVPGDMKPVAVRYCFTDYAVGSVYNLRGNPLSSFRTDDWNQ